MVKSKKFVKMDVIINKRGIIMGQTDIIIKDAFKYMVQLVSQKVENKKPKPNASEYVYQDYAVLENELKALKDIADDPAKYFSISYKGKLDTDLLEISRLTGVRFDRKLDYLLELSIKYYYTKITDEKELKQFDTEIKELRDKLAKKVKPGLLVRASMLLHGATTKHSSGKEKQK